MCPVLTFAFEFNQQKCLNCRDRPGFLALLCATIKQSYCRHAGVRRPSVRPPARHLSVKPVFSESVKRIISHFCVRLPFRYIFRQFFLIFPFLNFSELVFFLFTCDHMGEKFQTSTSTLKVHIRFTKISCILLGMVSTKAVQRIAKYQILDFSILFFISVNMVPYGSKSFKPHLRRKHICFPNFMYSPAKVSAKVVKRIGKV